MESALFPPPPSAKKPGRPFGQKEWLYLIIGMDLLRSGAVKRNDRFRACLQRLNVGKRKGHKVTETTIADTLGIEKRDIIAYLRHKKSRSTKVTPDRERRLAVLICGNESCLQWLRDGLWQSCDGAACTPTWVQAEELGSAVCGWARILMVGITRVRREGRGIVDPVDPIFGAIHLGGEDPDKGPFGSDNVLPGSPFAWSVDSWRRWIPEMIGRESEFAEFLGAMRRTKIWHTELFSLLPSVAEEVAKAYAKTTAPKPSTASVGSASIHDRSPKATPRPRKHRARR